MAKGKKYKKWFEKHGDERKNKGKKTTPVNGVKEVESPKNLSHPVHGYFVYECEECGAIYKMYLDKGLEDHVTDAVNAKSHKPVPFCIGCRKCNKGIAKHILWGLGDSEDYEELPEGANYFENISGEDCGKPVISEADARDKGHFYRIMFSERIGGRFA